MAAPTFNVVPIITDRNGVYVGAAVVLGLSTKADSKSDNGRLYATIATDVGGYLVTVYLAYSAMPGQEIAAGVVATTGVYVTLAAQNGSGLTVRVRLAGSGSPVPTPAVLVASLNVDSDIFQSATYPTRFPGYDATYGLAAWHAAAMRRLLTTDLPAALPNLYTGKRLSAFVPLVGGELPDLALISAPDALRDAHAMLVKHMAARAANHIEEFSEISESAEGDYKDALGQFKAANAPAEAAASATTAPTVMIGSFTRG